MEKIYFKLLYSYSANGFYLKDYTECDQMYDKLMHCFNAYLSDKKANRELNKSFINEPICYYRIVKFYDFNDCIEYECFRIVKHRNGHHSLKRDTRFMF